MPAAVSVAATFEKIDSFQAVGRYEGQPMRITILKRGGLSVYGGFYDAKRNVAVADSATQQSVQLLYPETITALAITSDGLSAGPVTISGKTATFTITGQGWLEAVATMGSDRPSVTIEAEPLLRSGSDYVGH